MRKSFILLAVAALGTLAGCSTVKGLFTDQGKLLAQAQTLETSGHLLEASALAAEALALDADYPEARTVLNRTYPGGQKEFVGSRDRWLVSVSPEKWDRLVELYRWENTLHRHQPVLTPAPWDVKEDLAGAVREASLFHWSRAQDLFLAQDGPRQARIALAEGQVAVGYDPTTPGLPGWMEKTRAAAVQKLMVIPFRFPADWVPGIPPAQLGSEISRRILEDPGLPENTAVFLSERLPTLSPDSPDGTGPGSLAALVKLADDAGQNLVLVGQVTKASFQAPQKTEVTYDRGSSVTLVDPDHPQGFEKDYHARVTYTTWTEKASLTASFTVVEVATGHELVNAVRDAGEEERIVTVTYTGDRNALPTDDLDGLARQNTLMAPKDLGDRVLIRLGVSVAQAVTAQLK